MHLGHTLGHALEAATSYRVFTHGEAVGYGMDFAADFGQRLGLTRPSAAQRIRSAIAGVGSRPPLLPSMAHAAQRAVRSDKKRRGKKLAEILLVNPQRPRVHENDARAFANQVGAWITETSALTRKRRTSGRG